MTDYPHIEKKALGTHWFNVGGSLVAGFRCKFCMAIVPFAASDQECQVRRRYAEAVVDENAIKEAAKPIDQMLKPDYYFVTPEGNTYAAYKLRSTAPEK